MRWPDHKRLLKRVPRLSSASHAFLVGGRSLGKRLRSLAARVSFGPTWDGETWSGRLTEEKQALLSMVRGMEAEFLATGDGLERLAAQLGEIQKECQSLTDLTLGQTQDAAVQFAFQLLKKAEDLVLASYEQYDHVFATFNELQQQLAQVSRQHDELMRVLLPLNFIAMAFRIEASRRPVEVRQTFFTLSDNLSRTVSEVRSTMERQFKDLAVSEQITRHLIEQISRSIQLHRKEISSALAATRAQLGALSQALISSGAGATDLTQRNQVVTSHLNGIVMALQYQDITRQRIEHVGEAMDEMREHLDGGRTATPAADADPRLFIFQAGQIQLQQVQSVFGQLNQAADSLKSGILNLRTDSGAAAEVAVKVGGTTLDAKAARQCQAGIAEMLGIVKQSVRKIAEIIAAFEPLQASFVDCTGKASILAGDVRRAGLNAQVFAIRTPDGATLEVLAGRVHAISQEVIEQVDRLGDALSNTSEMVHNLRQRLEDFGTLCKVEQEILADESSLSMDKLTDLGSAIPVQIRGVRERQGKFAESVEKVLVNIQFPVTVAQASSRAIGFFQELVTWAGTGRARLMDETAATQKIDQLKSKYTMESELHAHAAGLQPAVAPSTAQGAVPSIELFDDFTPPAPAIAVSPAEISLPGKPPEDPPGPAEPAAMEIRLPTTALSMAEKKPAASGNLGDNVELF